MRRSLALALAAAALAATPLHSQSLRGSPASVERMYQQALHHELHFYETSAGVRRAARDGVFVRLSSSHDLRLRGVSHPYVLPGTATFVQRLAGQYHAACGEPLVVTSGVRPRSLRLANSVDRSVHPTGMAVDLRAPTRRPCLAWLRATLSELDGRGVLEATEEHHPAHFHVAVYPDPYRRYIGGAPVARVASAPSARADAESPRRTYTVRRGDSLWAIARRSRLSVESLRDANGLRSSRIVVGQRLVLPDAE